LGDGFSRHADSSSRVLGGLSAQHRRDPGHDDLPISVLLAGVTGSRGGNRERPDSRHGNRETPGDGGCPTITDSNKLTVIFVKLELFSF